MDRGAGTASAGSFVSISENEHRCYSGLYTLCQADSSGKLAASKVGELFRASQLPGETLHQIAELCGAKRLGYFGSGQFYVALKLLAAAQAGLPVSLESIKDDLPLPKFSDMKDDAEPWYPNRPQSIEPQSHQFAFGSEPIPWTMMDRRPFRNQGAITEKKESWSPPHSPCKSPPDSPMTYHGYACSMQRNGTDTHIAQMPGGLGGAKTQQNTSSPSHLGTKIPLEHITLTHSTERPVDHDTADYSDDPWRITEEQQDYYTNQFKSLQPDLGALILGSVARNFFTKSKLPIPELSHIWELSDVDRDGALTLAEFCTAFHLIVARKNGYPLPETLPPTLLPSFVEKETASPKSMSGVMFFRKSVSQQQTVVVLPKRIEPLISFEETDLRISIQDKNEVECETLLAEPNTPRQDMGEELSKSGNWIQLHQSFGNAVGQRVTTRLTWFTQDQSMVHLVDIIAWLHPLHEADPHVRSRARPRSYSSTSIEDAMKKVEQPPTPPPRPQKSHSRASSLDLSRLFQQSTHGFKSGHLPPPPALPPRPMATQISHFFPSTEEGSQKAVHQPNFANFGHFKEKEETLPILEEPPHKAGRTTEDAGPSRLESSPAQPPQKPVRRKYRPESQVLDPAQSLCSPAQHPSGTRPPQKLSSRQKKDIQLAIRKNKETNAVLLRLNGELQQQLKAIHQERIHLESQLEVLRPLAFI